MEKRELTFDDLPDAGSEKGPALQGYVPGNDNDISFDDLPDATTPENVRDPATGVPGGDSGAERSKAGYKRDLQTYGMGKTNELPEPATNMYDQFPKTEGGYKEALKLYEFYKNHEESGMGVLGPTYKNKYVPAPNLSEFMNRGSIVEDVASGDVGLGTLTKPLIRTPGLDGKAVGESLVGGINNAGKNILITVFSVLDTVGEKVTGQKGVVTEYLEENIPEWNAKDGIEEVATLGTELAVGAASGGMLGASSKALAATLAAIGSVAATDENIPTLVTGDNALFQIFEGVPTDNDGTYAQDVLEKKINLAAEALVAEGVVGTVADGLIMIGGVIKHAVVNPISNLSKSMRGDKSGIEALQIQQVMDALSVDVTNKDSVKGLRDTIDANKKVEVDLNMGGKDKATIERTTMSSVQESTDSKLPMDLESGQLQKGSPQLQTKIDQPVDEMGNVQDAATREYGGITSARQAGDEISDIGAGNIEQTRQQVEQMKAALAEAEKSFVEEMASNPELGSTVQRLSDASGVQIFTNEAQTTAENVMIGRLKGAVQGLVEKKNALYDAIPDDVDFDIESFSAALSAAEDYIPNSVRAAITENVDFKTLHNQVVPELSRRISILMSRREVDEEAVSALINLRDNIYTTQLDFIINNGDEVAANAAREAKRFYAEEFAPLAKTEPLDKLFDVVNMTTPRKSFEQTALDTVNTTVKESKRFNADKIVQLLKTTDDPEDLKSLSDVVVGRTITKIRDKFSSQNISDISSADLIASIKEEAGILSREYPEIAKSFDDLVKQIESKQTNLVARKQLLDEFVQNAKEVEQDVLSSVVGKFLNVTSGSKTVVKNVDGYEALSKRIFSNKETGLADVQELVTLASQQDNPLILEGLKGGYFKHLQDGMFKQNKFQAATARELLDPESPFFKMGQEIFKDTPEVMERIHDILVVGFNETVKRDKLNRLSLINPNQAGLDASAATNIVITQVFGVLNRLGARVRSGAGAILKKNNPAGMASAIADEIFANPDYAIQLLDAEIAKFGKGVFDQAVSKDTKLFILKALGRSGFIDLKNGEEEPFIQQWDRYEQEWLKQQSTDKQTEDVFLNPDPKVWGEQPSK